MALVAPQSQTNETKCVSLEGLEELPEDSTTGLTTVMDPAGVPAAPEIQELLGYLLGSIG
jgi:hypothetical protein